MLLLSIQQTLSSPNSSFINPVTYLFMLLVNVCVIHLLKYEIFYNGYVNFLGLYVDYKAVCVHIT